MPREPGKRSERRYPIKPLAGGLNDAQNPVLLNNSETPDCENVDFDRDSIQAHGGAIKFNNQTAPHAGLLTRVSYSPLYIDSTKSVPQRGYGFVGYSPDTDIGGDFAYDGTLDPSTHTYHARRGVSFCRSISFAFNPDEQLYGERRGSGAPATDTAGFATFDEALEDCTCIVQKGGDGYSAMSWALAVVNTGSSMFEDISGLSTFDRVSNYALVFMWLDSHGWGASAPASMRYMVGAGGDATGASGRYSTLAYRAIIAKAFVEPGRTYHVAIDLNLDTGTPGTSATPTSTWNQDGTFQIVVADELGSVTNCATLGADLFVWKGPSDSYDYLVRYGIRFSGRDPEFLGLGYRFAPWNGEAFIPYGLDSASMEGGGFRMLDVSAQTTKPTAFTSTQTLAVTAGNDFAAINQLAMHAGAWAQAPNPLDPTETSSANPWTGLGSGGGTVYNQGTSGQSEALRNYYIAIWGDTGGVTPASARGGRLRILYYYESGGVGDFKLASSIAGGIAGPTGYFIQAFRWNQRPLRLSNYRGWSSSRDWTDARTKFSLSSYSEADDATEPDLQSLVFAYPLDDAGGAVLRETVAGRSGYIAPYALGSDESGLFLSGEGEAVCLDFSENPVLVRELGEMLRSGVPGFAIEMQVTIPQAYYARAVLVGSTERISTGAPIIASWETKDDDPGMETAAAPILRLGHHSRIPFAYGSGPFHYPMGFNVEAATQSDQDNAGLTSIISSWAGATSPNFSVSADWVGRSVRLQVGVQSNGTDDSCSIYLAMSPKSNFDHANGDASDAEFAYFETATIARRDLVRSVVVIGGAWRPDDYAFNALNCRMIVQDVRIFGAAAPGSLPAVSGDVVSNRDGKLIGLRCMRPGKLERSDLLRALGSSSPGVNVTEGSTTVYPSDASAFFDAEPESTLRAIKETYLLVGGDGLEVWKEGTTPTLQEEFYYVRSVASGGSSLTLSRNFNDRSRDNAYAASFRVIGYTHFSDYIGLKGLAVGKGTPFVPGSTDPSDAVLTEPYFANLAPCSAPFRVRVYAGQISARDLIPKWVRGLSVPRRNPVLGMASHQGNLFAVTRGCLYLCDDRWRVNDGPTDSITGSLAFLGEKRASGISIPDHADMVRFTYADGGASDAMVTSSYDAWVKLSEYATIQTIMWIGKQSGNPELSGEVTNLWVRISDGYPEICIGSDQTYDGSNKPDKGLFVARSGTRIRVGEWTHVRWTLPVSSSYIEDPVYCFVNGRRSTVTLLATENGAASGQWMRPGRSPTPDVVLLGCARDAHSQQIDDQSFSNGVLSGRLLSPNLLRGYIHGLMGQLAGVVIDEAPLVDGFVPSEITYTSPVFSSLLDTEGVGHKVYDSAGPSYGVIESHPAVSLFHEMGMHTKPASWAMYGNRLFVTNGGRPVYASVR